MSNGPEQASEPRSPSPRIPIPEARWPSREEARASRLFSPIRVGAFESRTRSWVPAMVPWRSVDEGFVTDDILDWYGRFADGRPGVLVVEATGIREVPSGPLLRIGHDRFLPGLRELARVVRERSQGQTRLVIQVIDFLTIRRRPPKEKFLRRFLEIGDRHRERLAALEGFADVARGTEDDVREALLALPHETLLECVLGPREVEDLERGYRERVNDLELAQVRELPQVLPDLFAAAAGRARETGFDGVELHYAHAYTMASFLSRLNMRDDGYGGSRENRVRLPVEVLERTRREVGDDWTVGCRILGDEVVAGGGRIDDASFYGAELARSGVDYVSISKGGKFEDAKQPKVGEAIYPYTGESGHECMPTVRIDPPGPFGRNLPLSHAVRDAIRAAGCKAPVVGAGGINSFELAERALREGDCDLVGAARQSLADPDWWLKMELGRGDAIRRCIYTNYCEGLDQKHRQVTCQLWDRELDAPDPPGGPPDGLGGPPDGSGGPPRLSRDGKRRLLPPAWKRDG